MIRLDPYYPPQCHVIEMTPGALICDSPVAGGNEGVGYEPWSL